MKKPVTLRKNPQASRRKVSSSSVASSGTSTWVREKLATRKINCGNAPEAKKASVWKPTPRRVTTYQGISTARMALQIASPARMRLNLINCEKFPQVLPRLDYFLRCPPEIFGVTNNPHRLRLGRSGWPRMDNAHDRVRRYSRRPGPLRPRPV